MPVRPNAQNPYAANSVGSTMSKKFVTGKSGAENVLALRCLPASRRREQFWKARLNTHAAHNDSLSLAA